MDSVNRILSFAIAHFGGASITIGRLLAAIVVISVAIFAARMLVRLLARSFPATPAICAQARSTMQMPKTGADEWDVSGFRVFIDGAFAWFNAAGVDRLMTVAARP